MGSACSRDYVDEGMHLLRECKFGISLGAAAADGPSALGVIPLHIVQRSTYNQGNKSLHETEMHCIRDQVLQAAAAIIIIACTQHMHPGRAPHEHKLHEREMGAGVFVHCARPALSW